MQIAPIEGLAEIETTAKILPLFKKHVDLGKEFGITKALMDRLNYLLELLKNAEIVSIDENGNHYKIHAQYPSPQSNVKAGTGVIGLEYYFVASSLETAKETLAIYKEEMSQEAMKVFLGFWKMANEKGSFSYSASLVQVMQQIAGIDRQSYYSVKEKKRFWALTKLLENTKLTLSIPLKKKGKNSQQKLMIEHRLLEVFARDSEKSEQREVYPNKLSVQVLDPKEFEKTANLASAIANGTLNLPPQDVMLAISLQTRAAQRRDERKSRFDEDFLIERGHLQGARKSNPRVARQRLKKKLETMKDIRVIKSWKEDKGSYVIEYNDIDKESEGH